MFLDLSILYLKLSEMVISLGGGHEKQKKKKVHKKVNVITEH